MKILIKEILKQLIINLVTNITYLKFLKQTKIKFKKTIIKIFDGHYDEKFLMHLPYSTLSSPPLSRPL